MSDISALENRITAALDRIRQGLDQISQTQGAAAALQQELEAERSAKAELVETVRGLKERQDSEMAALSERVAAQSAQLQALDAELQKLRASNAELRELNGQLRAAVTEGLAPELFEGARSAEIDALQAQRSADAAEIDAILAELKPLMEGAAHAAD